MRKLTPGQLNAMKWLLWRHGGIVKGGAALEHTRKDTIARLLSLGYITEVKCVGPRLFLYESTERGRDAVYHTEGRAS